MKKKFDRHGILWHLEHWDRIEKQDAKVLKRFFKQFNPSKKDK